MALKVKKNKTPKAPKRKGRYGAGSVQKQSVIQNVKVNINKPSRVPKEYKVKQLGRDGAGGAMPNVRELPSSSFQIVNNQPRPLLYNEMFGNARPVSTSPFERLLASQAVEDNKQAEVGQLRNSLESSRLKEIQRQPIMSPASSGESEVRRFLERARASSESYTLPFSVTSVDEQGTIGVSLRSRIPQEDYIQESFGEYRVLPSEPRGAYTRGSSSTIESVLQDAQSEERRSAPRSESNTFRAAEGAEYVPASASTHHTYEEDGMPLGVTAIPDRLVSYLADQGTSGDILQAQREEYIPLTQAQIKGAGKVGRPVLYSDTPHRNARETASKNRKADKHYRQTLARKLFSALKV